MAVDLEAVNKLRVAQGLEPLTELPKKDAPTDTPPIDNSKDQPPVDPSKEVPPAQVELNQDAVLEFLRKQGIEASTLEDLKKKPDIDPVLAQEQRDAAVLSFGLQKGKFNKKKYESFVTDSNDLQNLVFQHELAEAQKEDPELTVEEFQSEFSTKHGLDAEPNTRKYKAGQKTLSLIGNQILKGKYKDIYDTEGEYTAYERQQMEQTERNNKIKAGAVEYKKKIDTVFGNLKKISAKFSDTESYEVATLNDSLESLKSLMVSDDYATQQILNNTPVEDLQEIAYTRLLRDNFPVIAKEIAIQYNLKNQKGTRGIPATGPTKQEDSALLSPEQQKFVDLYKANNPVPAGAN